MKALIQRVAEASVITEQGLFSSVGKGILIFLAVEKGDILRDLEYTAHKAARLRIFEDAEGKMNLSLLDVKGDILVVSQFTLAASCRKGNRPSFDTAEDPVLAERMYEHFVEKISETGLKVSTGKFGSHMRISLVNDGPVTILIDSRRDTRGRTPPTQ